MSTLRISDAPLLPDVDGTEKIPTGGRGDYAISVDQIKDHIFQDVGKELVGLGNVDNTSDLDKPVSTAQQAALDLKADKTYVDTNLDSKADKTNVYTRSETTLALSKKADLVDGLVPESQIPSSFNDVLEFTTNTLPIVGESGKIYVTTDTNRTWRWSGNQYVEVSNGGTSDSTQKLQTPRKIANVDFDGTQNIDIPHNNLTNRNVLNAHAAEAISTASGENQQEINDYTGSKWRNKVGGYDLNSRVMLDNGDIVKSIIAGNTVDPNVGMTGWLELETALSTKFSTLNKAINRVIADRFLERVSVKDFGAIGDGTLHTLQEWVDGGKFSGLTAIQMVMPFVTSLTQSIDWAVTQYCLVNFKNILIPKGKYVFSDVAKFPDNISPFNVGTSAVAPRIFGDGVCTTITRNDERPATRIMNAEGTSTTQESDTANLNEACFSIHCPYAQISDLTIESSRVGIYFGQDFAQPFTSLSSVSKSNINRVQINRCGTGVLMLAAGGNHYVDFSDIHFTSCQIDVHQRASFWWKITQGRGDANNNRNCFTRIRSGRSRVGYWNDCGDTNTLIEWHGEGINHTTANNPYPVPEGLPTEVPNGSCMFVFTGSNQLNKISYCNLEQVGYHVYNAGSNNTFSFNLINEAYVKNVNPPKEWFGRYVTRFRGYGYADNVYPDAFPELAVAGRVYFGLDATNGTAIVSNNKYHIPTASTRGSYDTQFQVETGAIVANAAKAVQLWGNIDASSCAMINVDIVGRCDTTGQISSFNTKVMINAYRTTARALTRFGVSKISSSRATFEGTLDTVESNHIAVTLQKNATTPQILEAVLSCPFDLTSATVFVDIKVMK